MLCVGSVEIQMHVERLIGVLQLVYILPSDERPPLETIDIVFNISAVQTRAVKILYLNFILFRSTFHIMKYSVLTDSISHHVSEKYSGFCNMQMRCLMTSVTRRRPNKLPQVRNISINNCAHCNVLFLLAYITAKIQYNLIIISVDIPPLVN